MGAQPLPETPWGGATPNPALPPTVPAAAAEALPDTPWSDVTPDPPLTAAGVEGWPETPPGDQTPDIAAAVTPAVSGGDVPDTEAEPVLNGHTDIRRSTSTPLPP